MRLLENSRKTDITFWKSGRIEISSWVARAIGLQNGDVIDIFFDDNEGEYYLYVKLRAPLIGRHVGVAFKSNRSGNHFRVYSKKIAEFFLSECKANFCVKLAVGQLCELPNYGKAIPIIINNIIDAN